MNRQRAHVWDGLACRWCGIRAHWAGAREGCEGTYAAHRDATRAQRAAYNSRRRKARKNEETPLRQQRGLGNANTGES